MGVSNQFSGERLKVNATLCQIKHFYYQEKYILNKNMQNGL